MHEFIQTLLGIQQVLRDQVAQHNSFSLKVRRPCAHPTSLLSQMTSLLRQINEKIVIPLQDFFRQGEVLLKNLMHDEQKVTRVRCDARAHVPVVCS